MHNQCSKLWLFWSLWWLENLFGDLNLGKLPIGNQIGKNKFKKSLDDRIVKCTNAGYATWIVLPLIWWFFSVTKFFSIIILTWSFWKRELGALIIKIIPDYASRNVITSDICFVCMEYYVTLSGILDFCRRVRDVYGSI